MALRYVLACTECMGRQFRIGVQAIIDRIGDRENRCPVEVAHQLLQAVLDVVQSEYMCSEKILDIVPRLSNIVQVRRSVRLVCGTHSCCSRRIISSL